MKRLSSLKNPNSVQGASSIDAKGISFVHGRNVGWSSEAAELTLLASLIGFYALVGLLDRAIDEAVANVTGGICLIAIMSWGGYATLKREPLAIWGALFWFRAACAVYYGVGALVPYVGTQATLLFMQSLYPFSDAEILKVNAITTTGIFLVLLAGNYVPKTFLEYTQHHARSSRRRVFLVAP